MDQKHSDNFFLWEIYSDGNFRYKEIILSKNDDAFFGECGEEPYRLIKNIQIYFLWEIYSDGNFRYTKMQVSENDNGFFGECRE